LFHHQAPYVGIGIFSRLRGYRYFIVSILYRSEEGGDSRHGSGRREPRPLNVLALVALIFYEVNLSTGPFPATFTYFTVGCLQPW